MSNEDPKLLGFEQLNEEEWSKGPPVTATQNWVAIFDKPIGAGGEDFDASALVQGAAEGAGFEYLAPHPFLQAWLHPQPEIKFRDNGCIADVTINYTSQVTLEKLTDKPAEIEWESVDTEVDCLVDRFRNPIVNRAGEQVYGLKRKVRWAVARVTKHVPVVPQWFLTIGGLVNSDAYAIDGLRVSPRYSEVMQFTCSKVHTAYLADFIPYTYRTVMMRVLVRDQKIAHIQPNVGRYELVKIKLERPALEYWARIPIVDAQNRLIDEPEWLTAEGSRFWERIDPQKPLSKDNRKIKFPLLPEDIIADEWELEDEFPFSALPIN